MHELVECMSHLTSRFRAAGADRRPHEERDGLVLPSCEILHQGVAAHRTLAPLSDVCIPTRPGRRAHDDANHLLDALRARAEQVLAFLDDLAVPLRTTQAESDLRMINVQHTMSGTGRRAEEATAFCVSRSARSTMRTQGRSMLAVLTAVCEGIPCPIAWEPGT